MEDVENYDFFDDGAEDDYEHMMLKEANQKSETEISRLNLELDDLRTRSTAEASRLQSEVDSLRVQLSSLTKARDRSVSLTVCLSTVF